MTHDKNMETTINGKPYTIKGINGNNNQMDIHLEDANKESVTLTCESVKAVERRQTLKSIKEADKALTLMFPYLQEEGEPILEPQPLSTDLWLRLLDEMLEEGIFSFSTAAKVALRETEGDALPVACYVNETPDSLAGIMGTLTENATFSAAGGGISSNLSSIRPYGTPTGGGATAVGTRRFAKMFDSTNAAVSQGPTRKGATALWLDVTHPEALEFINIRRHGGDPECKTKTIHHGVIIGNDFLDKVNLSAHRMEIQDPKTGTTRTINPCKIMEEILKARVETGEPYIFFKDNANVDIDSTQKEDGQTVNLSNLCTEIMIPTDEKRSALCVLGSINIEKWARLDAYKRGNIVRAAIRALDTVLGIFIRTIENQEKDMPARPYERVLRGALGGRPLGLGVMGFHAHLQSRSIPMDSPAATEINKQIFAEIADAARAESLELGKTRGPCEDHRRATTRANRGAKIDRYRNAQRIAIAPTATISIEADTSPGIEPFFANAYVMKTAKGDALRRNPHLVKLIRDKGLPESYIWSRIQENKGSIQGNVAFTEHEQSVFKTAHEIDQDVLIDLATGRQPYICQGQSLTLFEEPPVSLSKSLNQVMRAWKGGLKSLYYLRARAPGSNSIKHATINTYVAEGDKSNRTHFIVCEGCE